MVIVNLAPALALLGKRVLAVDLDPQGPLARGLGARLSGNRVLLEKALRAGDLSATIVPTRYDNIDLVPGDLTADPEEFPARVPFRDLLVRRALASVEDRYDIVLIDTKGNLDLLTTNAILAADWVILACEPDFECGMSAQATIEWIHGLYDELKPGTSQDTFIKILLTKMRPRVKLGIWLEDLVKPIDNPPFKTRIGLNQQLPNARERQQTVFEYAEDFPNHEYVRRAKANFVDLAKEVIAYDTARRATTAQVAANA